MSSNKKIKSDIRITKVLPNEPEVQLLINKLNEYQSDLYGPKGCTLETSCELIENNAHMIGA